MAKTYRSKHRKPEWQCGAEFSGDGKYRYRLWRIWNPVRRKAVFIGLNPSTAGALEDDQTVARCIDFALQWGMGGMYMLNAYALCSTDPMALSGPDDPIGPRNNQVLREFHASSAIVVACWGANCRLRRQNEILKLVGPLYHLGLTTSGFPRHPSRIARNTELVRWQVEPEMLREDP